MNGHSWFSAVTLLLLALSPERADAFAPTRGAVDLFVAHVANDNGVGVSPTELGANNPPASRQKPRRLLKKRRSRRGDKANRRREGLAYGQKTEEEWQAQGGELRPLIRSNAVEAGEDYWIDESDLRASQERERALKARKSSEERIPDSKLWDETLAPYRQNWIGYFSVLIVILGMMVTQFPELLQSPVIQIPDL